MSDQQVIELSAFVDRVVTSCEKVQLSEVDPYGHLNASRYAEYLINHRFSAVEDQLKVSTIGLLRSTGIAFVVTRLDIRYLRPCFLGEVIETGSWVVSLEEMGFSLNLVMSSESNKKVRAHAQMDCRSIVAATGKSVAMPTKFPTRATPDIVFSRPLSADYLSGLLDVPSSMSTPRA
jgi:YbgC/YbaW family acyl-CoA thioester hydrolase